MAMRIGADKLVYALMTKEGDATTAPVYATPKTPVGLMSLNINPNSSQETAFYDDGPGESATTLGAIEVEIQKNELLTEELGDFLGHKTDDKGALVYGAADVAPWLAIGFRSLKSNGKYKYVWLLKGKFREREEAYETKGDTINFQSDTIIGQFAKINTRLMVKTAADDSTGTETQPWKTEIDGENASADATTIKNWFTQVYLPSTV